MSEKYPCDGKQIDSRPIDGQPIDKNWIDSPESVMLRREQKARKEQEK